MRTDLVYLLPVNVVGTCGNGPYSAAATRAWDLMSDWLRSERTLRDVHPDMVCCSTICAYRTQQIVITRPASRCQKISVNFLGLPHQTTPVWCVRTNASYRRPCGDRTHDLNNSQRVDVQYWARSGQPPARSLKFFSTPRPRCPLNASGSMTVCP